MCIQSQLVLFLSYLVLLFLQVNLLHHLAPFNCFLHVWWQVCLGSHASACNHLKLVLDCQLFDCIAVKYSIWALAVLKSCSFYGLLVLLCNVLSEKANIVISFCLALLDFKLLIPEFPLLFNTQMNYHSPW